MPELRTARENARLEIGSQRGRNSRQIGVLGIYDLQGLSYGLTLNATMDSAKATATIYKIVKSRYAPVSSNNQSLPQQL